MVRHPFSRLMFALLAFTVSLRADAFPVTGWLKDTSFGGGSSAALSASSSSSPVLGNGASNNADNTAIFAPFSPVALENGQRITLTASAQLIGTSSTPDFRWGLFKDDGVGAVTGGWLGYMASAESTVWAKNPSGNNFANVTFASTTESRAVVLGQTPEPNDIAFSPGTYQLALDIERFGQELDVRASISNASTGYAIATTAFTEANPARLTFAFDRVGFLAGSVLDADQIRFSNVDVSVSPINQPTMQIHSSGLTVLTNPTGDALALTQYELTSAAGSLSKSSWTSFDDREGGDPIGSGWDEAISSNSTVLAEVNLFDQETLISGDHISLGKAFSAGAVRDVAFRYTADGIVQRGIVEYLQSGDYNRDGSVDAADYVVWRKTLGTITAPGSSADGDGSGLIDDLDYTVLINNFGQSSFSQGAGSAAPEPGGGAVILMCVSAVLSRAAVRIRRFDP